MINIYLSSQIYIKANTIDLSIRRKLKEKYTFSYFEFRGKEKVNCSISLLNTKKYKDNLWICLPPNLSYLLPILDSEKINYTVIDSRSKVTLEMPPTFNKELRENQLRVLEEMKKVKYNCILNLPTNFGKTLMASYMSTHLKTTVLFVASKSNYIQSFINEVKNNTENGEDNYCIIDSNWLKNPEIKPIMVCAIQVLHKPEILEALKNKIGCLIADEIHSSIISNKYKEGLFGVNCKYRIYLSGTPKTKSEGFVEAGLSSNIITLQEENINLSIAYQPILIPLPNIVYTYRGLEHFHEKKKLVFEQEDFIPSMVKFVKKIVERDRQVLVFSTNKYFQERLNKALNDIGIPSQTLNSNTSKSKLDGYFSDFESGIIKVFIGGTSVVEALSLYKLSVFINTDLSDSENAIIQSVGRLKRFKPEICDKSKIYIKFIYQDMTESKFRCVIRPVLKSKVLINYVELKDNLYLDNLKELPDIVSELF